MSQKQKRLRLEDYFGPPNKRSKSDTRQSPALARTESNIVLQETRATEAQRQQIPRTRVFDRVVIPKPKSSLLGYLTPPDQSISPEPSDPIFFETKHLHESSSKHAAKQSTRRKTGKPTPNNDTVMLDESSSHSDETSHVDSAGQTRRPRKAQRVSYLPTPLYDDSSGDELARHDVHTPESDFEKHEAADASSEVESVASSEEKSSESDEDGELFDDSDDVKPRMGRAKITPARARPAAKAQSEDTSEPLFRCRTKKRMVNLTRRQKRDIALDLPPLSSISEIFTDMTRKALPVGLAKATKNLKARPLRVATMCSGTESPLLALEMIRDVLTREGKDNFIVVHLFSAEIVPYKQAYIERNFSVPIIFRDITELTKAKDATFQATTAYGSKADVPKNIDLLIAGTACVDFSMLNNKQKELADHGESGDTFRAVLAFAKVWRPRMLILENVFNAPWDDMLSKYEDAGYDVGGVLVDTKDFYLPQTRQRGYMACFNRDHFGSKGAKQAATKWQDTMDQLKRPASSPISAFLLSNDDPIVLRSRALRAKQALMADNVREVDWSKCAIRHIQYRGEKGLGTARPFTSWQESGTLMAPDYADREWLSKQVERIWDMLDCSIIRKALPGQGNYDAQFKTRIWEMSQNIDRFTDTAPFGISSCLTPTGIPYVTDRGGPLTFHESMMLQGLPLDKISFTTETGPQIQDLAGNAMSSTVVGSAIIAALTAGFQHATDKVEVMDEQEDIAIPSQIPPTTIFQEAMSIASSLSNVDMVSMMREANQTSQKCTCEGPNDVTEKPIQACQDCGHTSCLGCGGKPMHNYDSVHTLKRHRRDPSAFVTKWAPLMPFTTIIKPSSGLVKDLESLLRGTKQCQQLLGIYRGILSESFRFCRFDRAAQWTVMYESSNGRLDLVMSSKTAEWQLYAKPDAALPGNDALRLYLQRPIAKFPVDTQDDATTACQWRVPDKKALNVKITPKGDQVASWLSRLNVPSYENQRVSKILEISISPDDLNTPLSGTYEHFPHCGTACESLYRKAVDASSDPLVPVFLMLDTDSIGDPSNDAFVFTTDPARKRPGESRQAFASLEAFWRPWLDKKQLSSTIGVVCERWVPSGSVSVEAANSTLELRRPSHSVGREATCTEPRVLFDVQFPYGGKDNASIECSGLINAMDKKFFSNFSWVFQPLRPYIGTDGWQSIDFDASIAACQDCVPEQPSIRWKLGQKGNIKPYEDPNSATRFEQALKKRPELFEIRTHLHDTSGRITIALNIRSLAHRAVAKLEDRHVAAGKPSVSWTMDTNFAQSTSLALSPFTLKNNDRDQSIGNNTVKLEVDLWPKQKQSLAWMLSQEQAGGQAALVEQSEEAILPYLGWRAEARASRTEYIKGGIQASHPGFGKTICTLALIQSDYQGGRDERAVIADMNPSRIEARSVGLERLAATMVIAPKHLTKQWRDEVDKVLGKQWALRTITIHTASDLAKYELQSFRSARIIIVNQEVLTSDAYVKRLANFAGIPEPSTTKGREFKAWLEFAMKEVPEHLKMIRNGNKGLAKVVRDKFTQHLKDETFQAIVPSKRLKGQAYADNKASSGQGTSKKQKASAMSIETDKLDKCLFEWFEFNRIVVDEFTYLDSMDYASVNALRADKRWALSATARLQDVCDIARMASLIGVKLRVGENAPGAISNRNLKAVRSEMTDFELFQTFREAPSNAMTERTHELAQKFLDDFVRQNILEFEDFPYEDHVVPVTLDLHHRIVYTELSQHLNSLDMRIKKGSKRLVEERDREHRLYENLKDVESAEEALSRLAAEFDGSTYTAGGSREDMLISKRRREYKTAEHRLAQSIRDCQKSSAQLKGSELGFEKWKTSAIADRGLGDEEATQILAHLIADAEQEYPFKISTSVVKKTKKTSDDEDAELDAGTTTKTSKAGEKLKELTSHTNALAKQFLATRRSIRFVENAKRLSNQISSSGLEGCDCVQCRSNHDAKADMAVSSLCGHLVCTGCLETIKSSSGLCQGAGCMAPVQDYHLLRSSKISAIGPGRASDADTLGAKIRGVLDRLERIRNSADQAILFVRYESQISTLEAACSSYDIKSIAVRDDSTAARQVTLFQSDLDPSTRATVIILNASNASAAGVNLTNANHVLFLSPLLTDTQYDYDASMAQAIGRVRRPGQSKPIHVYRFVALDTIDVDILEHRDRRNNALTEYDASAVPVPASVKRERGKARLLERERTQLIRGSDGVFRLMPKSWLLGGDGGLGVGIEGRARVKGYEDFSSLVKFSKAYSEDD